VQKYEQGTSRVGSRRLFEIAAALELPIGAFFEGARGSHHQMMTSLLSSIAQPHALEMLKAFCQIDDVEARRALVKVAERLASRRRTS
jgi:hypothetical protein